MLRMSEDILIVGAGPTGLALAIEMLRFGIPVRLIDKADHPAKYSQALVVQARTLEQFDRYGIADRAVALGRPIRHAKFYDERKLIAEGDLSRIPGRFPFALVLPQNETEALLTEHLHTLGGTIERQVELTALEQNHNRVHVQLQHADGAVEQADYRWVIGCDGAHSAVRKHIGIPFEGDTVTMAFALGDLRLRGVDVPGEVLALHWRHGGDVLFVAQLKDDLYRIIRIMRSGDNQDNHTPTVEEFNATFADFGLDITAESGEWLAPFRVNERRAKHPRAGNVFLAGDASHIHSPAGGQGMNTGIQDAANLAWKLATVLRGADAVLLDSYETERGEVSKGVLRTSGFALRMATSGNTLTAHLRDFVMHHALQLGFVQDAVTRNLSEVGIAYRKSPAVRDTAGIGPLHAGDRMPDAWHEDGTALLSPLRDAQHLLIALDVPSGEVPRNLRHTSVVELSSTKAGWTPALQDALGVGPMLYLVRPDGYIGYRGKSDSQELWAYALDKGLM